MKKFFKALALLLALVLVIGSIPVAAAEQGDFALKGKVNKKTGLHQKIIYIGGAKGVKDDEAGTVCKTGAWANVAKLVKGFDADTMYIELESSDKDIVRTESGMKMIEDGKYWIKSKGIGSATVTVKVFAINDDGSQGTLLYNEDLMVTVKKNAEAVNYKILDAEGNDMKGKKLGANTPYTFILTRLNEEGAQIDTDLRRLVATEDKKDAVEIVEANEYTTKYTVTFKKSGDFTLLASAYQSKSYNKDILEPEKIDVTVGYDVKNVAQKSIKSVDVTFDQKVSGLTKNDFKAYYELTNGTKYYPSEVKEIAMNENVCTVTFFANFKQDTEYFLEYNGDTYSFKTTKVTADSVDSIVVLPTKVKAGSEETIVYQLLDANGIDITGDPSLNGWINIEGIDLPLGSYISGEKVYLPNAGVSGKVKVTYNWINTSSGQKNVSAEGQVYSVAKDTWVFASVTGVTTSNTADSYVKDDNKGVNEKVIMTPVTMDYASTGAAIQIAVKYDLTDADGKVIESKYESLDKAGFNAEVYASYKFKSSDETVVMLEGVSGRYCYFITNKVGTANIVIYGVKNNNAEEILGVMTIEVKEAKKPSSFNATTDKVQLNAAYPSDKIEITGVLKNQYDEEIKGEKLELYRTEGGKDYLFGFSNAGVAETGSDSKNKIVITADDVKALKNDKGEQYTGTVNLVVKVAGKDFKYNVTITVGNESSAASYSLKLSGTSLDTNVTDKSKAGTIEVSIIGQSKGFATSGAAVDFLSAMPESGKDFATSGYTDGQYVYVVEKDGAIQKSVKNFSDNKFTSVTANASGAAVLLDAGNYSVKAFKINKINDKVVLQSVGVQSFTVTDNQTKLEWSKTNDAEKLADITTDAGLAKAFKITFNGAEVTDKVRFESTNDGYTAYVKCAYYDVVNENGWTRTIKVDLDTLVKKVNS